MSNSFFPKVVQTDETDPRLRGPQGWTGKLYKLLNPLRFKRKELRLSNDLYMTHTEFLEGHIRVGGVIEPGNLTIGFYGSADGNRLAGAHRVNDGMAVSYNGCKWDAVSKAPAYGAVIHFSHQLTESIVSPSAHAFLMNASVVAGERLSLVSPVTPMGESLRKAIRSSITLAEEAERPPEYASIFDWMANDLVSMAACLIDEVTEDAQAPLTQSQEKRFEMARQIERFLWEDPSMGAEIPTSLDEMADYFGCQRRTIQAVVKDYFGVGFVALKRSIRLHQVNAALTGGGAESVTSAALDHNFEELGRFSGYYKKMFGELPSESLRRGDRDDASRNV